MIIGRTREQQILKSRIASSKAEFIAIYGRRRIGKTYLIRETLKEQLAFFMTGAANVNTAQQLSNFHTELQKVSNISAFPPGDWFEAFQLLIQYIETKKDGPIILFFDELPWLDTKRSQFIQALEYFWNSYGSAKANLKLIVCGSAASWMLNKLIKNKGGLHNRVTERILLEPFTLAEVELYLNHRSIQMTRYQIIQLYSVIGGIPYYLDAVEKGKSVVQIIDALCFEKTGLLRTEYEVLFASIFRNHELISLIVEALAKKDIGLTREEIISYGKLSNGGTVTEALLELEVSGFVQKYQPFGKAYRGSLYQIIDPFILFHHKFIKNSKATGQGTWINIFASPAYHSWSGYAFERICLLHVKQLKAALGIAGIYSEESSWRGSYKDQGSQIDLLIDRKDGIINICEMKFSDKTYTITKAYAQNLRNKMASFSESAKTKKALLLVFVSPYGLTENMYKNELVFRDLDADALF